MPVKERADSSGWHEMEGRLGKPTPLEVDSGLQTATEVNAR